MAKADRGLPRAAGRPASLRMLGEAGIPAFRTPESCADAIRAFLDWQAPRDGRLPPRRRPCAARAPDEADARTCSRRWASTPASR
jgi:acyl-CoA synthetase (NDP forming)